MQWDSEQLFPITGLPKIAGVGFGHLKTMNAFHDLIVELRKIDNYHEAIYSYIDELQGYMHEY